MIRNLHVLLLALLFAWVSTADGEGPGIQVLFPVDGLILTPRYDNSPAPGLQVWLVGLAPFGFEVQVNDHQARLIDGNGNLPASLPVTYQPQNQYMRLAYPLGEMLVDPVQYTPFFYQLEVRGSMADLEIVARRNEEALIETATFYYRSDPARTFAITIDDAADLFAEIARRAGRYTSIFDHPILTFLRDLHQQYGAVFSFYLFQQGTTYPDFDLSQMPDKFRAEWTQNSSWLRLGFHAQSMLPIEPYAQGTYQQARSDFNAVRNQVFRFAGPQVWDLFMRSHYWSGSRQSCQAWRSAGTRGLYGAIAGHRNYYLTAAQNPIVNQCDYWWDQAEDIIFVQTDIWIERDFAASGNERTTSSDRVAVKLDSLIRKPYAYQNIEVFTHESLLFDHAVAWQVRQRLEETVAWMTVHGYTSRFDADDPFLGSLPPPPPYGLHLKDDSLTVLSLSWNHHQSRVPYHYLVYRKDLSAPLGNWMKIGETGQQEFVDSWQPGLYAYRVFAVNAAGRRSAGSRPVRIEVFPNPDFNENGVIDTADFFVLMDNFGRQRGEPDFDLRYDLNGDGVVDWADLTVLKQSFGKATQAKGLLKER